MCRRRSRGPRRGSRRPGARCGGTSAPKRPRSTFVVAATRPLTDDRELAAAGQRGDGAGDPDRQQRRVGVDVLELARVLELDPPVARLRRPGAAADQVRPRAHRERVVAGRLEQRALVAQPLARAGAGSSRSRSWSRAPSCRGRRSRCRVGVALVRPGRRRPARAASRPSSLGDRRQDVDRAHRGVLDPAPRAGPAA